MATLVVLVWLAASLSLASSAVLITTLSYTGSYEINVRNKRWFVGSQPFVVSGGVRYGNNGTDVMFPGEFPTEDQPLPLKSVLQDRDQDVLGPFLRMRYVYFAGLTRVELEIRSYVDIVVFAQDAMTAQYNGVTALRTQAGLADDWLKNLTSAASEA